MENPGGATSGFFCLILNFTPSDKEEDLLSSGFLKQFKTRVIRSITQIPRNPRKDDGLRHPADKPA